MRWFRSFTFFTLLVLGCNPLHAAQEQVVRLERKGKAPLFYLAAVPDAAPRSGALVFVGGDGVIDLGRRGIPQPGDSFLLLQRQLLAEQGILAAFFDPGPEQAPLSDRKRMSLQHADDVTLVLADMRARYRPPRVVLVGASRGTVSAAYLAVRLGAAIDGVVLASTVFSSSRTGPGLEGFDFNRISAPLMFLHHRHDGCGVTPPAGAERQRARHTVVLLDGGLQRGEACGPFSPHGFLGQEGEAVQAIASWILALPPATK